MEIESFDVIVIGAGAAGLAAMHELESSGLSAICVEARNRVGGRIWTIHDPVAAIPLELGAEFVHGRSSDLWKIIRSASLTAYDCEERVVYSSLGAPAKREAVWDDVNRLMEEMMGAAKARDETFAEFVNRTQYPAEVKQQAISYVEGFNAARQEMIGIASLAKDAAAADEIDGDHSFRILNGYDSVMYYLLRAIEDRDQKFRLNRIVESIRWAPGKLVAHLRHSVTGRVETILARKAIVTIPLGVLQAESNQKGAIRFDPEPMKVLEAARALRFGQVVRVVLRFREAFWEERPEFARAGFLFSQERFFPTWWTALPVRTPVITGWSAGPHADELWQQDDASILDHGISSLSRILEQPPERVHSLLEGFYFHNWCTDPFSRGAYSYVPAGAMKAREALTTPVAATLYFAGEATELNGHSATVHGAIASGCRAARQVVSSLDAAQ